MQTCYSSRIAAPYGINFFRIFVNAERCVSFLYFQAARGTTLEARTNNER